MIPTIVLSDAIVGDARSAYFIHARGTDYVKIGWTAGDASARVKALQPGCPFRLALIGHIITQDATALERLIHAFLDSWHVRGEWYELSEACATLIGRPPTVAKDWLRELVRDSRKGWEALAEEFVS